MTMAGGGAHPGMATHNRLLRLGDVYLEVLAHDPSAAPTRARWFGLDDLRFGTVTSPSVRTFVLRSRNIDAALASIPEAAGPAIAAQRGAMSWRIGVPDDGHMPFDGAFPTIIEWPDGTGPVASMPDSGCRLETLNIRHPQAAEIARVLAPHVRDHRIEVSQRRIAITRRRSRRRPERSGSRRADLGGFLLGVHFIGVIVDQLPRDRAPA